ncbi:hypothetical protein PInf_002147 [Phytophthora infestans]|nr:hypothetical protein PInf_002147 [Phytophthora infestans]
MYKVQAPAIAKFKTWPIRKGAGTIGLNPNPNRVIEPKFSLECKAVKAKYAQADDGCILEVETGQPIRWNDQNFQYYKKLTEITARKKDAGLYNVMSEQIKYDEIFTSMQKGT